MTHAHNFDPARLEFDLSDRLAKALKVAGITGREMAEYLDLTPYTVSRYVNGHAEVPVQALRLWALRTGVPFEWLRDGKTPAGDNPGGGEVVRHQGIEPRTHWLSAGLSLTTADVIEINRPGGAAAA